MCWDVQALFDFAAADLLGWHARLLRWRGDPLPVARRTPTGQLVKSIISARTRDAVSTAAYDALAARYPDWGMLAAAPVAEVRRTIAEVTYPEDKADYLTAALREIGRERPDHRLEFLGALPLRHALAWLERLPGVARKVAASTLNSSTLARPVFIVDTHVLRVLRRLRFVRGSADYREASEAVTAALPDWPGDDFLRLHILTKRLGQTICRWDVPECARCPLADDCPTYSAGR